LAILKKHDISSMYTLLVQIVEHSRQRANEKQFVSTALNFD